MRYLPNSDLDWSFAYNGKDTIIQESNVCYLCAKSVALYLISLESVQLDELVKAPDSYRTIETCRNETGVRVFDKFHSGHSSTMPLKCMHHLLGLQLEVPFKD